MADVREQDRLWNISVSTHAVRVDLSSSLKVKLLNNVKLKLDRLKHLLKTTTLTLKAKKLAETILAHVAVVRSLKNVMEHKYG